MRRHGRNYGYGHRYLFILNPETAQGGALNPHVLRVYTPVSVQPCPWASHNNK